METAKGQGFPRFLDPEKIMHQLPIDKGSVIADFGCASGYFTIPFAKFTEENGMVYALDVLPQALETVESKSKVEGLSNVKTKRVNLENDNGSGLGEGSCDWVIMKDMLFQNKKRDKIIKESHRILKKDGRILVVEWDNHDFSIGPDKKIRIKEEDLIRTIEDQGFKIENKIEAGDFHYGVVAVK